MPLDEPDSSVVVALAGLLREYVPRSEALKLQPNELRGYSRAGTAALDLLDSVLIDDKKRTWLVELLSMTDQAFAGIQP